MSLQETRVGTLSGYDLGKRVVMVMDGLGVDGTLKDISWITFNSKRGEECYKIIITTSEKVIVTINEIPLDYLIQIDRGEADDELL